MRGGPSRPFFCAVERATAKLAVRRGLVRQRNTQSMTPPEARKIPRTVWALGFVSMFMDISSEMIHSLLPVFLVTTLGASAALLGVIEGVAEATASITKIFSG